MRIFLAGATGVIGVRLVPLMVDGGHEVAGMTRAADKAAMIERLGAEPVVCDVYDVDALRAAVVDFGPDLVMHQLTALPKDLAQLEEFRAANARIRTEGTANLLEVAGDARFVAQSIAWPGGDAVEWHERAVLDAGGTVLQYGQLYGPGTFYEGGPPPQPRIQIDAAAARTMDYLEGPPGTFVITDAD
jgi:nucleoside-diphosphate-sugar epimerase